MARQNTDSVTLDISASEQLTWQEGSCPSHKLKRTGISQLSSLKRCKIPMPANGPLQVKPLLSPKQGGTSPRRTVDASIPGFSSELSPCVWHCWAGWATRDWSWHDLLWDFNLEGAAGLSIVLIQAPGGDFSSPLLTWAWASLCASKAPQVP